MYRLQRVGLDSKRDFHKGMQEKYTNLVETLALHTITKLSGKLSSFHRSDGKSIITEILSD